MAAKPKGKLQKQIAAGDRAAIKRAYANPAWRRYLSPAQLKSQNPKAAQRRAMNERLAQPITPGSTTTERDLAREAHANLALEYGPQEADLQRTLGEQQQRERDTGSFYDQYLTQLRQNQANVDQARQQAAGQLAATQAGITGLGAANLTQLQNPAVADAQARGTQAADLTGLASSAAATRQALMGSFQAQQALQGAAADRYAGGIANVVGPGQKLQAQAQAAGKTADVRKQQTELTAKRSAADVAFRAGRRAEEAKNLLAESIATGKTKADLAKANLASKTSIKTAGIRAGATVTAAQIRAQQQKASRQAAGGKRATSGPFAGYTQAEIEGMSTADARKIVQKYNDKGGKDGKGGKKPAGLKQLTPNEQNAYNTQLSQIDTWAQRGKAGQPLIAGHKFEKGKAPRGDRATVGKRILEGMGSNLKARVLVTAGLDKHYLGYLSGDTVVRLHQAGLSADQISRTLGVPTWQVYKQTHAGPFGPRGR
jgi:hypothetical protein